MEQNKVAESTEKKIPFEDINEEKVLFEWESAERSFKKRDKDFWITVVAILVLVGVILIFIKEFFLIIALVSVLFLFYVLSTVPPQNVKSKITNRAVYFGELRYEWELLPRFWFKKSLDSILLEFETNLRFPRQISLVINPEDEEKIKEIVVKKIPLIESSPSFVDKLTKWFGDRLPLEKRDKQEK
jgi:predicted membrane protein